MKKIWSIFLAFIIVGILFQLKVDVCAGEESYLTYNEIMMSSGKLLAYFTEEEYESYYKKVENPKFWGINVYTVNDDVTATYISQTLYSVDNRGLTDITYELNVVVDTSNKTTWNVGGSINAAGKGTIKNFKVDLATKASIDYTNVVETSTKETQKMKIIIEKESRAIVYLMGNARVTNGVYAIYMFFIKVNKDGFEYFSLVNQYPRMEKRSI